MNIVTKLKEKAMPLVSFTWKYPKFFPRRSDKVFRFRSVYPKEHEALLRKLKRNKATGTDTLPANLLKFSASAISTPLAFIINMSLNTGVIPNE